MQVAIERDRARTETAETYLGPSFQQVEEITAEELARAGGFTVRTTPLLVKGALAGWPAMSKWTFEELAGLRRRNGEPAVTSFQNGYIEQGDSLAPLELPVGPYLRELGQAHAAVDPQRLQEIGLLPNRRRLALSPGETFHLDWSWLTTFETTQSYLAQWHLLDEFPQLRPDMAIRTLWPGWRFTWEFAFLGPANTVTGIHHDFPDNWFCQIRGVKEYVFFAPDQTPFVGESRKYDRGATLSETDITRLLQQPERAARFAKAKGSYARVEPGDALFVPSANWHAVVALTPAISLAVFGLTAAQVLGRGLPSEIKHALHLCHLYRWGNCTCHGASKGRYSLE